MRKAVDILKRTKDGRAALLEIIEQYGGFNSRSADDPIEQARLVAKRQVASEVMQALLTDPLNAFTLMMDERHTRLQVKRAEDEKNDDAN